MLTCTARVQANNIVSVSLRPYQYDDGCAKVSLCRSLKDHFKASRFGCPLDITDTFEGDFSSLPEFKRGRLGIIQARLLALRESWIDINATYTDARPKYRALARKIQLTEEELQRVAKGRTCGARRRVGHPQDDREPTQGKSLGLLRSR